LHDWDELVPILVQDGYTAYALDLLGHGESYKPRSRLYKIEWLYDHMAGWLDSLSLTQQPVLIGHSLGGYLVLLYAIRSPDRLRGLGLVDPFYRQEQLPAWLRFFYRHASFSMAFTARAPSWLLRSIIDAANFSIGHSLSGSLRLPAQIRLQTAMDYRRTSPGAYHLTSDIEDLAPLLGQMTVPCLLVWGNHDRVLAPSSFSSLAGQLTHVMLRTLDAGHIPHQSHPDVFNEWVIEFLKSLPS
jgi:pimeloyl-ACP methyl ester carboxylesterase